jgi:hypothetical protein
MNARAHPRMAISRTGSSVVTTGVGDEASGLPQTPRLCQYYANPFNPSTEIAFRLQALGFATLRAYDLLGIEARTLVTGNLAAGVHKYTCGAAGLAGGVHFYRLQAGAFTQTRKLIVNK